MVKSKTFIVLILLISVVLCPLCAQEIFSVSSGANISYSKDSTAASTTSDSFLFDKDSFAVGLELRTNLSYFQLDAVGEVSVLDSKTLLFSGILSAGTSVEIASIVKVGLTFGPRIAYIYSQNSRSTEEDGLVVSNGKNFIEAIKDGPVNVRLMLDVYAGPVITVGLAYTIPTDFTLSQGNWEELLPSAESFKSGQISLCIQMKLF
jgi:hypothetical protein